MADFKLGVIISAVDKITKPLAKINKSIEKVVKPVRLVQNSFRRLGRETRMPQLLRRTRDLNSAFGRLSSTFTSSLRKMSLAAGGIIATIGFLGRSVVGVSSDVENLRARLISMTKSEEIANKKFAAFQKFANESPFTLPEIMKAGVTLEAFGITSDENLVKLGDLAAFMGEDIVFAASSLGRAFAGGAGAADIFRERGILDIFKDFMELKFGVRDLTKITLPAFRKVIFGAIGDPGGKIAGATARLAKTFSGKVSMMGDAIFNLKKAIGDTLLPSLKKLVDNSITPAIKAMGKWVKINEKFIEQKFSGHLDGISRAIRGITKDTDGLRLKFKSFFNGLRGGLKPLSGLIEGVASFSGKSGIFSGKFEMLGFAISALFSLKILAGIGSLVLSIGGVIKALILFDFSLIKTIGLMGVGLVNAILQFSWALLASPITWYIAGIAAITAAAYFLIKNWKPVSKFFSDLWNDITSSYQGMRIATFKFFSGIKKDTKAWMDFMLGFDLFDVGSKLIDGFLGGMKSAWANVASFFSSSIDRLISAVPDSFKEFFGIKVPAIVEKKTIGTLKATVPAIPTFRKRESLPLRAIPSFAGGGGVRSPGQQLKGNITIDFRNAPRGARIIEKEIRGNTDVDIDAGLSFAY